MIFDWFAKRKHKMFPWMGDFTSNMDGIRNVWNPKHLSGEEWFWCHPSAYMLMTLGAPICGTINFLVAGGILYWWRGMTLYFGFCLLMVIILGRQSVIEYKKWQLNKMMTMYDLYLREPVPNIKIEE